MTATSTAEKLAIRALNLLLRQFEAVATKRYRADLRRDPESDAYPRWREEIATIKASGRKARASIRAAIRGTA